MQSYVYYIVNSFIVNRIKFNIFLAELLDKLIMREISPRLFGFRGIFTSYPNREPFLSISMVFIGLYHVHASDILQKASIVRKKSIPACKEVDLRNSIRRRRGGLEYRLT